ncbi:hypothetical protein MHA01_20530 [Marinococcus halophilus]|uniref:Uncharacterized protein n=1 Tax=Marinococcus halophilus TaxID=1371 RepID=A0A510Y704_MARHA|nr:hypothetical protein MHA01_20530 [Marinococcus halophilus]
MIACVDFRESYKKEPKRPAANAGCEDVACWLFPTAEPVEDGKREEEIVKKLTPLIKFR